MRYLLLAVGILVSAGTASADWDEVMNVLERATRGPAYDVGADPSEPGWIATRKARFESEPAKMRNADLRTDKRRDAIPCREPNLGAPNSRCD